MLRARSCDDFIEEGIADFLYSQVSARKKHRERASTQHQFNCGTPKHAACCSIYVYAHYTMCIHLKSCVPLIHGAHACQRNLRWDVIQLLKTEMCIKTNFRRVVGTQRVSNLSRTDVLSSSRFWEDVVRDMRFREKERELRMFCVCMGLCVCVCGVTCGSLNTDYPPCGNTRLSLGVVTQSLNNLNP